MMAKLGCFIAVFAIELLISSCVVEGLGVNWGELTNQKLPAKVIVNMLKENDISKVKLFEVHEETMKGLAGTDIEVMVAIPNPMLQSMTDLKTAQSWVEKNVTKYMGKGGVNIKYVAVGNEPFLTSYNGSYLNTTFPALKNVQTALNKAGIGNTVKATVPMNADIYTYPKGVSVPSAGFFRPDIGIQMNEIAKFLEKNKSPFSVNIYPFLNVYQDPGFPMDFAFFDGQQPPIVDDANKYTNALDAAYDTLVVALGKIGVKDIPIFIGEVGWPTDGTKTANVELAQRFYSGLMKKLNDEEGTPLRPKQDIEIYLFALLDEDAKSVDPGEFERHWGIFTIDGQPKYPLDLSGDKKDLVGAKGVKYLPKKWCVLSPNAKNESGITANIEYACTYADCTPLSSGSSCSDLDAKGNASYAFNIYFQTQQQKSGSCKFDGLAMETTKDPSTGNCTFPIRFESEDPKSVTSKKDQVSDDDDDSSSLHYEPLSFLIWALEVVALLLL